MGESTFCKFEENDGRDYNGRHGIFKNKSGVQERGPCKCNDVSHVMIWDGVEHGERIQEPFKTNVTRGSWWQTDSYKLQISYAMYKDNITLASYCEFG